MSEFVYILENPSMPNLVKIGRTERSVAERVVELSSHTGVPSGFIVVKEYSVANSSEAERIIHERLSDFRVADNREFFKIDAEDAMEIIESILETVKSATCIDFDREDELVERAIPVVVTRGVARPRELESMLGISYQDALLVITALRGRGVIGPNNEAKGKIATPKNTAAKSKKDTLGPQVYFDNYVLPGLNLLEQTTRRAKVTMRELLDSEDWAQSTAKIPVALGGDAHGDAIVTDLAKMPHLLIAGEAGSGKSICINSIIASMLYRFTPEDIRFIMIDPRAVGMQIYDTLPHLVIPVLSDPNKVVLALRWAICEMEKRYLIFAKTGVGSITSFNGRSKPKSQKEHDADKRVDLVPMDDEVIDFSEKSDDELFTDESEPIRVPRDDGIIVPDKIPYIVVIIEDMDELMEAPTGTQETLGQLARNGRAAGIHLILSARQTKSSVISESLKASIPARIAFRCASRVQSREILGQAGAEKLSNVGEMLFSPWASAELVRVRAVLVTDDEIRRLVDFVSRQSAPVFETGRHDNMQSSAMPLDEVTEEDEELVQKCIEIMRQEKKASTSLFQRRLRLGYTRAARVVDILEQRGYIAAGEGATPREILRNLDARVHSIPNKSTPIAQSSMPIRGFEATSPKSTSKNYVWTILKWLVLIVTASILLMAWIHSRLGFSRN